MTFAAENLPKGLGLNEDLAEAIAMGHDLGHTPFGHAGEVALTQCLGRPFRHNEQSLRVVDVLEKDGDHPTWSVSMHFTELQHFFNTTDIMGTDAYPFLNHEHDLTSLEFAGQMVRRLNVPHFLVAQGFSWAYYEPVEKIGDIETWKRYRNPTESEMRSMCLSHALDGATGFLYYYFPAVTNPNIPIPNYRQDMLKSFKNVNIALKKIERWILSGNDINMLEVKNLKGRVRAGVLTDENNQRCVLVVGGALGNQAEFELNGEFESMFGLCKKVNNKWVFTCDGVSSDILIEKVKK